TRRTSATTASCTRIPSCAPSATTVCCNARPAPGSSSARPRRRSTTASRERRSATMSDASDPTPSAAAAPTPGSPGGEPTAETSLGGVFHAFALLGATSFGGGVVAYLRQALVVRERWLDDETFLSGLELSQMLPGLNATNMSVYV